MGKKTILLIAILAFTVMSCFVQAKELEPAECLSKDTLITMADGSLKPVQDIVVGDVVKGHDGNNTVLDLYHFILGDQPLYSINGGRDFVTRPHPFLTKDGWKAINVEDALYWNPDLDISLLEVGDVLLTLEGEVVVEAINPHEYPYDTPIYNFAVDGDRAYYADGYLVHNKGCDLIMVCSDGSAASLAYSGCRSGETSIGTCTDSNGDVYDFCCDSKDYSYPECKYDSDCNSGETCVGYGGYCGGYQKVWPEAELLDFYSGVDPSISYEQPFNWRYTTDGYHYFVDDIGTHNCDQWSDRNNWGIKVVYDSGDYYWRVAQCECPDICATGIGCGNCEFVEHYTDCKSGSGYSCTIFGQSIARKSCVNEVDFNGGTWGLGTPTSTECTDAGCTWNINYGTCTSSCKSKDQSCTYGNECCSDYCINGYCKADCTGFDGTDRCSYNSDTSYINYGSCAEDPNDSFCDTNEMAYTSSTYYEDCRDALSGYANVEVPCDNDVSPGPYSSQGVCAHMNHDFPANSDDDIGCVTGEVGKDNNGYFRNDCVSAYNGGEMGWYKECDNDVVSGNYVTNGICVYGSTTSSTSANINCDSGEVCYDEGNSKHRSDCQYCDDGEFCVGSSGSSPVGTFTPTGICVYHGCDTDEVCGAVGGALNYDCAHASCTDKTVCDKDVTSPSLGYSPDGICCGNGCVGASDSDCCSDDDCTGADETCVDYKCTVSCVGDGNPCTNDDCSNVADGTWCAYNNDHPSECLADSGRYCDGSGTCEAGDDTLIGSWADSTCSDSICEGCKGDNFNCEHIPSGNDPNSDCSVSTCQIETSMCDSGTGYGYRYPGLCDGSGGCIDCGSEFFWDGDSCESVETTQACATDDYCADNFGDCKICSSGKCVFADEGTDPNNKCADCYSCQGGANCALTPADTDPLGDCSGGSVCSPSDTIYTYPGTCDGSGSCKPSSGSSSCSTCQYCETGDTSCKNVPEGSDPNADCSVYTCTSEIRGWGGTNNLECRKYTGSTTNNGDCMGDGTCASLSESCTGSTISGTAQCGSVGCKKSCPVGGNPTSYNTVSEVCYTSGQNDCSEGYVCDSTGTCVLSDECPSGTCCNTEANPNEIWGTSHVCASSYSTTTTYCNGDDLYNAHKTRKCDGTDYDSCSGQISDWITDTKSQDCGSESCSDSCTGVATYTDYSLSGCNKGCSTDGEAGGTCDTDCSCGTTSSSTCSGSAECDVSSCGGSNVQCHYIDGWMWNLQTTVDQLGEDEVDGCTDNADNDCKNGRDFDGHDGSNYVSKGDPNCPVEVTSASITEACYCPGDTVHLVCGSNYANTRSLEGTLTSSTCSDGGWSGSDFTYNCQVGSTTSTLTGTCGIDTSKSYQLNGDKTATISFCGVETCGCSQYTTSGGCTSAGCHWEADECSATKYYAPADNANGGVCLEEDNAVYQCEDTASCGQECDDNTDDQCVNEGSDGCYGTGSSTEYRVYYDYTRDCQTDCMWDMDCDATDDADHVNVYTAADCSTTYKNACGFCGDGCFDSSTEDCDGSANCDASCNCVAGYDPDGNGNCINGDVCPDGDVCCNDGETPNIYWGSGHVCDSSFDTKQECYGDDLYNWHTERYCPDSGSDCVGDESEWKRDDVAEYCGTTNCDEDSCTGVTTFYNYPATCVNGCTGSSCDGPCSCTATESATCSSSDACAIDSCAGTTVKCHYTNSWVWDTTSTVTNTDESSFPNGCTDGKDNDCDNPSERDFDGHDGSNYVSKGDSNCPVEATSASITEACYCPGDTVHLVCGSNYANTRSLEGTLTSSTCSDGGWSGSDFTYNCAVGGSASGTLTGTCGVDTSKSYQLNGDKTATIGECAVCGCSSHDNSVDCLAEPEGCSWITEECSATKYYAPADNANNGICIKDTVTPEYVCEDTASCGQECDESTDAQCVNEGTDGCYGSGLDRVYKDYKNYTRNCQTDCMWNMDCDITNDENNVVESLPGSTTYSTKGCNICGDGWSAGSEECDGDDLEGETCASLGLSSGTLSCTSGCNFDTSGCGSPDECTGGDCCDTSGDPNVFRGINFECNEEADTKVDCNPADIYSTYDYRRPRNCPESGSDCTGNLQDWVLVGINTECGTTPCNDICTGVATYTDYTDATCDDTCSGGLCQDCTCSGSVSETCSSTNTCSNSTCSGSIVTCHYDSGWNWDSPASVDGTTEVCNDGWDNDCDDGRDYDGRDYSGDYKAGIIGDESCKVSVTGADISESCYCPGDSVTLTCSSSVGNIRSLEATLDGSCNPGGSWSGLDYDFNCPISAGATGTLTATCGIDTSKSWQQGFDQTDTIPMCGTCGCASFTNSGDCTDNGCHWESDVCEVPKYYAPAENTNGGICLEGDNAVYVCKKDKCSAVCDGDTSKECPGGMSTCIGSGETRYYKEYEEYSAVCDDTNICSWSYDCTAVNDEDHFTLHTAAVCDNTYKQFCNECGDGCLNSADEECDYGSANADSCTAPYGGSCTYCDTGCFSHTVEGPYCGDGNWDPGFEECDGGVANCDSSCNCNSGYNAVGGSCVDIDEVCDVDGDEDGNGQSDYDDLIDGDDNKRHGDIACPITILDATISSVPTTTVDTFDISCEIDILDVGPNSIFAFADSNGNRVFDLGSDIDFGWDIGEDGWNFDKSVVTFYNEIIDEAGDWDIYCDVYDGTADELYDRSYQNGLAEKANTLTISIVEDDCGLRPDTEAGCEVDGKCKYVPQCNETYPAQLNSPNGCVPKNQDIGQVCDTNYCGATADGDTDCMSSCSTSVGPFIQRSYDFYSCSCTENIDVCDDSIDCSVDSCNTFTGCDWDYSSCFTCGDGWCDTDNGESAINCPEDCDYVSTGCFEPVSESDNCNRRPVDGYITQFFEDSGCHKPSTGEICCADPVLCGPIPSYEIIKVNEPN